MLAHRIAIFERLWGGMSPVEVTLVRRGELRRRVDVWSRSAVQRAGTVQIGGRRFVVVEDGTEGGFRLDVPSSEFRVIRLALERECKQRGACVVTS